APCPPAACLAPPRHPFPTRRSSDLLEPGQVLFHHRKHRRIRVPQSGHIPLHLQNRRVQGVIFTAGVACSVNPLRPRRLAEIHTRSEEHTSELQSRFELVCRLRLEKK